MIRDEYLSVDEPSRMVRRLPDAPHRNDARPRGEDWTTGFTIAPPTGTAVTPAVVSAAASGEVFDALVRGPVRARVIVTGDEIRRTGPLREGQTRDSVGGILPLPTGKQRPTVRGGFAPEGHGRQFRACTGGCD